MHMADNIIPFPPTLNFDAAIDDDTMGRMEKAQQLPVRGQQRRCALVALARNRTTLMQLARSAPDSFAEFAGAVEDFRANMEAGLALAEAAYARIQIVKEAVHA
jgi:hypothetical protein